MRHSTSTAKIALWYTASSILVKGIVYLTTPLFTRLMTKAEFGEFSNFCSWEAILSVVVTLDLTVSITRAKYDFGERMDEYLSSVLLTSNFATLFFYLIFELNSNYFEELFSMNSFYIRVMFISLIFHPAFQYLQVKHRIYRKYKFFVGFSVIAAVISTGISVLLVFFLDDKLEGRIYGHTVPIAVMSLFLWIYVVFKGRKLSFDCIKYALVISIPLIPHTLSGILLGNSDRVMITNYCGSQDTAMYTLAYQICLLANLFWSSMNKAWSPWLYDNLNAQKYDLIKKNSKIYLGFFAVLITGIFFVSPEILLIMGGHQYYEARYCMPPVILGCVFQFAYGMYVNLEIYEKKTFVISIGTISAALLNIVLNIIFVPIWGYIAAAYTTLLGYLLLFGFHYVSVKRISKELHSVYEKKFVFLIIFGLSVTSIISLLLYDFNVVRYFVFCLLLITITLVSYNYKTQIVKILGIHSRS